MSAARLIVLVAMLLVGLVGAAPALADCAPPYCPSPVASGPFANQNPDGTYTIGASITPGTGGSGNYSITVGPTGGAQVSIGSGTVPASSSPTTVSAVGQGFQPSTAYSYSVSVTSPGGTANANGTFTTPANLPVTAPALGPSPTSANNVGAIGFGASVPNVKVTTGPFTVDKNGLVAVKLTNGMSFDVTGTLTVSSSPSSTTRAVVAATKRLGRKSFKIAAHGVVTVHVRLIKSARHKRQTVKLTTVLTDPNKVSRTITKRRILRVKS